MKQGERFEKGPSPKVVRFREGHSWREEGGYATDKCVVPGDHHPWSRLRSGPLDLRDFCGSVIGEPSLGQTGVDYHHWNLPEKMEELFHTLEERAFTTPSVQRLNRKV